MRPGASSGKALLIVVLLLASAIAGFSAFWFLGDVDGDGMVNYKDERPFENDVVDTDGDGIPDTTEKYRTRTDPSKWDTDGDGLSDYDEVYVYPTSPLVPDCDDDGLLDGEEILVYGTNPLDRDTDDDGWLDPEDVNPTVADFYENVAARVGEPIAIQLMSCYEGEGGPERVKNATLALAELSEEDRQILYDCGIIGSITGDGELSDEELAYLADVDRDGLPNSEDEQDLNPLNDGERCLTARALVARVAWHNHEAEETLDELFTPQALKLALDTLEESDWLVEGFGELGCHIYVLEAEYCPFLFDHLFAVRCLVEQVRKLCYEGTETSPPIPEQIIRVGDARNEREAERLMWQHISEAVEPIDELEDNGEINCLDGEDWEGFWHPDVTAEECVGQILLPTPLGWFKIKDMDMEAISGTEFVWRIFKNNTSHDPELGTTPNRWLIEYVREDFEENGITSEVEDRARRCVPNVNAWPHSFESYQASFDWWLQNHTEVIYIRGKAYRMTYEQAGPYLSVLIARAFGRAGFVRRAHYTVNPSGVHEEIAVIMPWPYEPDEQHPYGNEFGFWADKEAYVQDVTEFGYTPERLPLYIYVRGELRISWLPSP